MLLLWLSSTSNQQTPSLDCCLASSRPVLLQGGWLPLRCCQPLPANEVFKLSLKYIYNRYIILLFWFSGFRFYVIISFIEANYLCYLFIFSYGSNYKFVYHDLAVRSLKPAHAHHYQFRFPARVHWIPLGKILRTNFYLYYCCWFL